MIATSTKKIIEETTATDSAQTLVIYCRVMSYFPLLAKLSRIAFLTVYLLIKYCQEEVTYLSAPYFLQQSLRNNVRMTRC